MVPEYIYLTFQLFSSTSSPYTVTNTRMYDLTHHNNITTTQDMIDINQVSTYRPLLSVCKSVILSRTQRCTLWEKKGRIICSCYDHPAAMLGFDVENPRARRKDFVAFQTIAFGRYT